MLKLDIARMIMIKVTVTRAHYKDVSGHAYAPSPTCETSEPSESDGNSESSVPTFLN